MPKEKKKKAVKVELIDRNISPACYEIADGLIAAHHTHLLEAKIAFAWHDGWNEDPDGRVRLGQAKKGSDLDRELHLYDFFILLNRAALTAANFTRKQMTALIDHELCHCQVKLHPDGEVAVDDRGRIVYRMRKHDIEEFSEVVKRHGLYTGDLEHFADQCMKAAEEPLLA